MAPKKDGSNQNLDERRTTASSDYERLNDESNLDTREVSHDVEEGDEDYDDEELSEDDFDVDGDDEQEDEDDEIV